MQDALNDLLRRFGNVHMVGAGGLLKSVELALQQPARKVVADAMVKTTR